MAVIGPCPTVWDQCDWQHLFTGECGSEAEFGFLLGRILSIVALLSVAFGVYFLINKKLYKYCGCVILILISIFIIYAMGSTIINC